MGVEIVLKRISLDVLDRLRDNPEAATVFYSMMRQDLMIRPLFSPTELFELQQRVRVLGCDFAAETLDALKTKAPKKYAEVVPHIPIFRYEWLDPALDLDKAWDILQFILARTVGPDLSPLSQVVIGADTLLIPEPDDPAINYLPMADVVAAASALARADFAALEIETRALPGEGVYRWGPGPKEFLLPLFDALRLYYAEAASQGKAMLSMLA